MMKLFDLFITTYSVFFADIISLDVLFIKDFSHSLKERSFRAPKYHIVMVFHDSLFAVSLNTMCKLDPALFLMLFFL